MRLCPAVAAQRTLAFSLPGDLLADASCAEAGLVNRFTTP